MLSSHEQLKYSRQIMVKKIGEQGQLALMNATVLVVGIGGLGNPVATYLGAAGVGKLILCDGDNVEISNLQRQVQFTPNDIGVNKAEALAQKLAEQNPDINIETVDEMLDQELAQYYTEQVDVVIDCTDNIAARYLLNDAAIALSTPLVLGAATGFDGQFMVVNPNEEDFACYQCVFPESEKAPAQNCQTVGIIGPVLSVVGGMQALQVIKLLTGNKVQTNQLSLFDGFANQWQQFRIGKQTNCPACKSSN